MVIWKFIVNPVGNKTVEMPEGAKILTAMMQGQSACIWAQVDPSAPKVSRKFRCFATGEDFNPTGLQYIGSYQIDSFYMFHLFEQVAS